MRPDGEGDPMSDDATAALREHLLYLLRGGSAPNAFKGYAERFAGGGTPTCGKAWTTGPGNSSDPPATLPRSPSRVPTARSASTFNRMPGS